MTTAKDFDLGTEAFAEAPPERRSPNAHRLAAIALVGVAIILVLAAGSAPDRSSLLILYPCALAAYVTALLLFTYGDRPSLGLAEFNVGAWLLAFAAVAYGLATMSLLLPKADDELRVGEATVPEALLLVALGFTAFAIGSRAGPTRLSRRLSQTLFGWRSHQEMQLASDSALVIVYGAGIGVTALKILLEGGYGYVGGGDLSTTSDVAGYSQILTIGTFLRTAALYAYAARWASAPTARAASTLAAVFACEAIIGVLFATKESFVVAFLAVLIPLAKLRKKRIPWRLVAAAVVLFVFVVTPLVTTLRGEIRQGTTRLDASSSLRIGFSTLAGGDSADVSQVRQRAASRVASRIRLLDNQVVIMNKTPSPYAYRSRAELVAAPISGLIPRAVWPSKPLRLSGAEFYKTYYQGQGVSSSALTFQGSLFLYGGAGPALLGMLVLGSLVRGLDDVVRRLGPLRGGLVVLVVFVPFVKQELEATTLMASVPIFVVTYLLARWAVLRPHAPSSAASAA